VFAYNAQRSGHADGDLGYANEVFNVAGKDCRVKRILRQVREVGARLFPYEVAALRRHLIGIVVLLVARDSDAPLRFANERILLEFGNEHTFFPAESRRCSCKKK
jgi:hypothetical protein